jgi:Ca2+-binding EF-hand superfamily protein
VAGKLPRLAERFAWLDGNGDGFLDRDEMRPRKGR